MPFQIPNAATATDIQAEIDTIDIAILAAGAQANGVLSGCTVTAQATPNMTVAVAGGIVQNAGTAVAVTAGNVPIGANSSGNPRFDLVVVSNAGALSAVAGTPSSTPVFPTPAATSTVLAAVLVGAGVSSILSANIVDKRLLVSGALVINVKAYGAKGDGATDDTAAIQAAINASATGQIIFFPPGTYLVSSILSFTGNRAYVGPARENVTIKMANAANLDAVAAAALWLSATTTPTSDSPVFISNLAFDANTANQTSGAGHGLVLMNYYSIVDSVYLANCRGDGLRWTTTTKAGYLVSNTMVENHIHRVRTYNVGTVAGMGIHIEDSSFNKCTDGWIQDCTINMNSVATATDGIFVDASAGWKITGCHIYGSAGSGINCNRPSYTRVTDNYIETFGTATTHQWAGIAMGLGYGTWIASPGFSVVANNTIFLSANNASADNIGITAYVANGTTGEVIIANNSLEGVSGRTYGIWLQNQGSGCTLRAVLTGNAVTGWSTPYGSAANGGVLTVSGSDTFPVSLGAAATDGFVRVPGMAGRPTGTPADLTAGTPAVFDTTNNKLWAYNGGWKSVGGDRDVNVRDYGAKGDGRVVTDGAMTSGSATLTCATSTPFAATDVGKTVAVVGAGASGALLYTTISGFTDSGHVTLATTAGTNVSGATVTYGTDDGSAIQAAINAMPAVFTTVSGKPTLYFPSGIFLSNTASLTGLASGVRVMGSGRGSSVIMTAAGTHDMWTIGSVLRLQFDQISMQTHAGGGHIANQTGGVTYSGFRNCSLYQLNPAKSIWKQGSGQAFNYNFWQDCYLYHAGATSVPALDFTAGNGSILQGNTWDHVVAANDTTAGTWFADFATSAGTYDDNVFRDLIGQANNGGIVRIKNGGSWVFDNVHFEGLTTTVNHLIWVGQGTGAVASSRNIFRHVMRRGTGTLGTGLTDIFLESGSKATDTHFQECDQVGSTSAFTVNLNSNPDALALGCRNVTFQNPGTRFASPSLPSRVTFSNAAYTATSSDRTIAQIGTLSAAQVVTLPAASSVPPGAQILLIDESGTATATNTVSWARAGSDTINGAATNVVAVNSAYGSGLIESDGVSKWTTIALGGSGGGGATGALTNTGGGKATYQNHGNLGSAATLDLGTANAHRGTLNANCTLTFTGATSGVECTLAFTLIHDATTTAWTITWPTSVKWPNGSEPFRDTTTASTRTRYSFVTEDGGTTWDGVLIGGNFG